MNIGFDFRMGGTLNAGIGRYAFELLKAMLAIDPHDTFYVFYNESVAPADLDVLDQSLNVELVKVSARHYSIAEQTVFLRVLNNTPVDVMFFPNFNHPIWYKKPFVVTIHDMVHHRISGHKKSRWLWFKAYQMEMEHAARASRAIIAPSEAAKADIAHYFPEAMDKTSVVYEGAFLEEQPEELVEQVKQRFLLTRPYFLFVGTLERKKNIVGLARGFDVLLDKYKLDVDLVYAGKVDAHYPEEKFKALEIKHKDHLVFTGYVDDETLAALYQGAHAYVNASLNEGFGLPGVEAMRFGLPLAVANTSVFNEVYDNAALYFDARNPDDIAEQLRLLAVDRQYYEHKQEMAIARSRFFDWHKAAQKTLDIVRAASGKPIDLPVSATLLADN
ncbi:MAG: glycosyltransferase family 4 protein [Candidatus Doudnabacteria bacterium]|nr:glycosyltransferase family 4 protein [Candidatus Doudnabacteria bacterium]